MERLEVMQILEEKLRELNLNNHYDIFCREHNPFDGTHKESGVISQSSFNAPWLDVREYGEGVGTGGDDTAAFLATINELPSLGGTVLMPTATYNITSPLTPPVGKQVAGYITNITIQGQSSGLASGSATNRLGTRINSYIHGGALFDLHTGSPTCMNVQFKDFECFDIEGTGMSYGIHAHNFATGCVIKNVGFKAFSYGLVVAGYCYYSKFDRVASFYSRVNGIDLTNPNMTTLRDCQASVSTGVGLNITGTHGVFVLGGWYENNGTYGIAIVGSALRGPVVIGTYLEKNASGCITIGGTDAGHYSNGGLIAGCYMPEDSTSGVSILLGYAKGISVIGNTLGHYNTNRVIYSQHCEDCTFIGNKYHPSATTPLDVPTKNTIIEPQLHRVNMTLPTSAVGLVAGDMWNDSGTVKII